MSKTLKYTKITSSMYLGYTDEVEEFGEDFEYEVDDKDLIEAFAYIIYDNYFNGKEMREYQSFYSQALQGLKSFLKDHDYMLDDLCEYYEEEILEYFKDEAMDSYER